MNYVHGERIVELLEGIKKDTGFLCKDSEMCMYSLGHVLESINGEDDIIGGQGCETEDVEILVDGLSAAEWKSKYIISEQQIESMREECKMNRELRVNACQDRDFADGVATSEIQKSNALRDALQGATELAEEAEKQLCIMRKQFDLAVTDFVEVSNELGTVKSNRDCLIKKVDELRGMYEIERCARVENVARLVETEAKLQRIKSSIFA